MLSFDNIIIVIEIMLCNNVMLIRWQFYVDEPAGDEVEHDGDDKEDNKGQPGEEGDRKVEHVPDKK
jgi:hypothetical protein